MTGLITRSFRRRRHRHDASCAHVATARPRRFTCPVCQRGLRGGDAAWCQPHSRWECRRHPGVGHAHCTQEQLITTGWERLEEPIEQPVAQAAA